MRRDLPPLNGLRAFEAAARHGSFKRAASELGVTPTAISHQIRGLEAQLGLALFERRMRQVVPTEAGAQLYPALRDGFDGIADAVARLRPAAGRARVTISTTTAFAARWLLPRMAAFRAAHPGTDLHVHASDAVADLAASGIDVAVRYGPGPYLGLRSEVLLTDRFAPVVNPILGVRGPDDLASATRIAFGWTRADPANPTWALWMAEAGVSLPPLAELAFSNESHAIEAAVAGQGVALASLVLTAADLDAGRLVQPFGPVLPGHRYHLVMPEGRVRPPVAAIADWLRSEARAVAP